MKTHLPRTRSLIGALASTMVLLVAVMAPALADHDDDHTDLQDAVAEAQEALDDFAQEHPEIYDDGKCTGGPDVDNDDRKECQDLVKALRDAEKDLEKWEKDEKDKVWVCKMVGEPGSAVLASGKNPIHVSPQAAEQIFSDAQASFIVDGPDDERCQDDDEPSNPDNDPDDTNGSSSSSSSSSSDDEPEVLAEVLEEEEAVVLGETLAFTGVSTPALSGFGLALLAAGAWVLRRGSLATNA